MNILGKNKKEETEKVLDKTKANVTDLRLEIDKLSQLVKELKPLNHQLLHKNKLGNIIDSDIKINSKEIDKCYDSLILAKAWLGKVLGELGEDTPYKNDGNRKTVKDIEKTADVKSIGKADDNDIYHDATHIEKVDYLREEIKNIIIEYLKLQFDLHKIITDSAYNRIIVCLSEARFWLGFELQRIKEND